MGGTGTGKTTALRTLVEAGVEVRALFTEPGYAAHPSLAGLTCERGLHWHYVPPARASFDVMIENARKINTLTFESLSQLKTGMNKQEYGQYIELLESLANYTCDRCGAELGSIDQWDNRYALYLDSLSGVNVMALDLVVGAKPTRSPGEWGVAMDTLEKLITQLCCGMMCHVVITSHIERETNEVTGATQIMVGTLGRRLAPKLGRFFDDVILAQREGAKYSWSTAALNVDLKGRTLPIADGIEPSFFPVIEHWKQRAFAALAQTSNTATTSGDTTDE